MDSPAVRVQISGEGHPVLLIHGTPMSSAGFAPLVDALTPSWKVVVIDLPGYRGVPALAGPGSFQRVTEAIAEALHTRGLEDVSVLGASGGAYRAIALAVSGHIRVRRLMTLGGYVRLDEVTRTAFRGLAQQVRGGLPLPAVLPATFLSAPFAKGHPDAVREVASWADVIGTSDLAEEFESFADSAPFESAFAQLRIPIVARVGELDASTPPAWSEQMQRLNPSVRLEIVPGCGHALLTEDRLNSVSSVRRWLEE